MLLDEDPATVRPQRSPPHMQSTNKYSSSTTQSETSISYPISSQSLASMNLSPHCSKLEICEYEKQIAH